MVPMVTPGSRSRLEFRLSAFHSEGGRTGMRTNNLGLKVQRNTTKEEEDVTAWSSLWVRRTIGRAWKSWSSNKKCYVLDHRLLSDGLCLEM